MVASSAPAIILTVYMILTLPLAGYAFQETYLEYISLGIFFFAFLFSYMIVVNGCHNGKIKYLANNFIFK
jgi:membrane-anchored glycerophosphoryl diester phosphodiesterase (GDPDase)